MIQCTILAHAVTLHFCRTARHDERDMTNRILALAGFGQCLIFLAICITHFIPWHKILRLFSIFWDHAQAWVMIGSLTSRFNRLWVSWRHTQMNDMNVSQPWVWTLDISQGSAQPLRYLNWAILKLTLGILPPCCQKEILNFLDLSGLQVIKLLFIYNVLLQYITLHKYIYTKFVKTDDV